MNGGDHEPPGGGSARSLPRPTSSPAPALPLRDLRAPALLERQPVEGLPSWQGELRASGPSTVTMGVISNQADVRLAAAAAERAVERRGEPLSALFLPADRVPVAPPGAGLAPAARQRGPRLGVRHVVRRGGRQVLVRYAEARQIGDGLAAEAVAALAGQVDAAPGSVVVVNPSGSPTGGDVRLQVPVVARCACRGRTAPCCRPRSCRPPSRWRWWPASATPWPTSSGRARFAGHPRGPGGGLSATRWCLEMAAASRAHRRPHRGPIPALDQLPAAAAGARRLALDRSRSRASAGPPTPWSPAMARRRRSPVGGGWIANEHVRVDVDPETGTLAVTAADGLRAAGRNLYVDGGDAGDTYNWSPPAGRPPRRPARRRHCRAGRGRPRACAVC